MGKKNKYAEINSKTKLKAKYMLSEHITSKYIGFIVQIWFHYEEIDATFLIFESKTHFFEKKHFSKFVKNPDV